MRAKRYEDSLPSRVPLYCALVVVSAGLAGWSKYSTRQEIARLQEKSEAIARAIGREERELAEQSKKREDLLATIAAGDQLRAQNQQLAATLAPKRKQLLDAKTKWETLRGQFSQAIEEVRAAAISSPIPSLEHGKGEPFQNAKIINFSGPSVVIEHDAGTSRLRKTEVPPEVVQRLQLNWNPIYSLPPHPDPEESDNAFLSQFTLPLNEVAEQNWTEASFGQQIIDGIVNKTGESYIDKDLASQQHAVDALKYKITQLLEERTTYETRFLSMAQGHAPSLQNKQAIDVARSEWQGISRQFDLARREFATLQFKLLQAIKKAETLRGKAVQLATGSANR